MSKTLTLDLHMNDKIEHFEQDFVPFRKHIEMLKMNEKVSQGGITELEWLEKKATFIASLFSDKRVTMDAILDGLSSTTANEEMERVIGQMLGIDPNDVTEVPTA